MDRLRPWVLWLGLLPVMASAEIRIVGSDLLGDKLVPALQEYARRNDRQISVSLGGSLTGWRDIQTDRADIGLISFPPDETPPRAPYYAAPVAYHGIMVLVSAALPISEISYTQLGKIYGNEVGVSWKRWSDLGVLGAEGSRSVIPHALMGASGFLQEFFRYEVLRSRPLHPELQWDHTAEELMAHLQSGEGVIALTGFIPWEGSGIKAIAVSRDPKSIAYLPTPLAVHRRDYPLNWPVYVVFRRAQVSQLYPLLRFLLGKEVALLFKQARLMPLPPEAREDLLFGLEQLEK